MPDNTPILTCKKCGAPLAESLYQPGCLNCLLLEGLAEHDAIQTPVGEERFYQHYEILTREDGSLWELGRGAMGITYKARDNTLHVPVALKVINALFSSQPVVRSRFLREARAAARLVHPNVANVFHFGTIATPPGAGTIAVNEDDCFYAMEFVEGETLEARVQREGSLLPSLVIEIGIQVSRALVAAEKKGLVHCDLKPSNIMLPRDIEEAMRHGEAWVKVIDFGVAKAVSEAAESTEAALPEPLGAVGRTGFLGTPAFASPEQLSAEKLDVRSDIFSLGVTLWHSLTGELPFQGSSVNSIRSLQEARELRMQCLDDVNCPAALKRVLVLMLSFDKAQRPFSALALLEMLSNCLKANHPKVANNDQVITQNREAFQFFRSAQDALHSSYPTKARYEDAIHLMELAVASDPDFAHAHAVLAETHTLMYRHNHDRSPARAQSVLAAVETAQRLSPESGEAHRARGIYDYHIQHDYGRARQDFAEALRLLPNDADSMMGLGLVECRQNRWDEALEIFEKAAALNPYRPEYLNQWWRTLEALRRYPEARRVLDYMIKRHPENIRIRLNRAHLSFSENGDLHPLQEFLDAVPKDYDPDGVITFQRWGLARYHNDLDSAERVLAASPLKEFAGHLDGQFHPRATLELLNALMRNDLEKAGMLAAAQLPSLQRLVEERPHAPGPLMQLAICQAASVNPGNAVEQGLRALAMLPPEEDGIDGPQLAVQMIWISVRVNELELAMDLLGKYAAWPGCLSYGELLWDVTYSPLRSSPRFQKVLDSVAAVQK